MKKTAAGRRILCFLCALLLLTVPVSADDTIVDMSVAKGCHSLDAQVPLIAPSPDITNLYSAVVYDYISDTLLYAANPDQPCDPASLVKIMTGLIIAQQGNMEDIITVDGAVLETLPPNSIGINLQAGETITLQELLYALLVGSANDAAVIAADHVCGGLDAFITEMNRYAAVLGCKDTVFTNVHGIYDGYQVCTARDVARILSVAAENEIFMEAFSKVTYTIPATNMSDSRILTTSNYMKTDILSDDYLDSRVTGGRTGVMDTGERNLAVTAESNSIKLISVVLGSLSEQASGYGSFRETSALLDLGFQGHQSVQLFYKGQALQQFEVQNGDSYVSIGVREAVHTVLPSGVTLENVTYLYSNDVNAIQAPINAGDLVTTVQVWHKDICLAQADLYALHDVKIRQVIETEETEAEHESGASGILLLVAAIVGLFLVLLFGRRVIFRLIRSHQIRRHRRNRRRSR